MSQTAAALEKVRERIRAACERCGRPVHEVTLVAVSKTHPAQAVREAYEAGARDVGESYAQELRDKQAELEGLPDLRWHFVGAVQKNKVRYLAGKVALVHALDTEEAARALSERAERMGVAPVPALISVNVGGEASKRGVEPDALPGFFDLLAALPGLELRGLMCLPPFLDDPEEVRPYFRRLRELRDELQGRSGAGERFTELSMGMSHDLEVAVEEGATLVRVGTDIFGARPRRD